MAGGSLADDGLSLDDEVRPSGVAGGSRELTPLGGDAQRNQELPCALRGRTLTNSWVKSG